MNGTQFLKGLAIILVGVILLLNNLSILEWSVWYNILRLWPLLLVSLGISLIFRRRLSWLAPLVILIGIIIGASASYMGVDLHLEGKIVTEMETLQREVEMVPVTEENEQEMIEGATAEEIPIESTIDTEIGNEETEPEEEDITEEAERVPRIQKANLHLSYDIGTFTLEFPTPLVYQCQVSYRYPEFKPIEVYSISDHEANIYIHHSPASNQQLRNPRNNIDLKLNKDVIYDILIETGATNVDYDLSKFKVAQCSIKSGASNINIVVPQYNTTININSGVSKIDIAIPDNVGAMISLDTGLSMKDLDEDFQKQDNNLYVSENYNDSEYQVNINIDSGLSQINIHYM
jgi:hypothetical protein